jgi:hypothetical protein
MNVKKQLPLPFPLVRKEDSEYIELVDKIEQEMTSYNLK